MIGLFMSLNMELYQRIDQYIINTVLKLRVVKLYLQTCNGLTWKLLKEGLSDRIRLQHQARTSRNT